VSKYNHIASTLPGMTDDTGRSDGAVVMDYLSGPRARLSADERRAELGHLTAGGAGAATVCGFLPPPAEEVDFEALHKAFPTEGDAEASDAATDTTTPRVRRRSG